MDLQQFDGRDVRRTTISVTNAGDGLSQALKIDPAEMHIGDLVYVVLECEVAKLRFVPIGDGEDLERQHILRAGTGTIVDRDLVAEVIDQQRERIIQARDDESGAMQMDPDKKAGTVNVLTPERLREQHELGDHKRARKDCELCAKATEARKTAKANKADKATKKRGGAKLSSVPS